MGIKTYENNEEYTMKEKILNINAKKKEDKDVLQITQRTIKNNIKRYINGNNLNIIILSKSTDINILKLIFMIYFPFSKIKLSKAIIICNVLNLKPSDVIC
ncbi:hypothetical protein CLPUN_39100 [Clostridium puniceum]|uniref:Uncharacterized protein n=1 Tax=Clostridium puniceum TaxID=29367 RepID=A0A1S8T9K6_9CLOT|nr:hypothetical protein [Clostridium puniceum]OOM74457.1 hypothetical protein CLPUN_39100 [Clostridium puniceum]